MPIYCHALLELTLCTIDNMGYACLLLARRQHDPALVIKFSICRILISSTTPALGGQTKNDK